MDVDRDISWRDQPADAITADVVVPVLNEAQVLDRSIRTLHRFLTDHIPQRWQIVIAENGSSDGTVDIGRQLCQDLDRIRLIVLKERGRGRALRAAWTASRADIVSYTDADLSTDLEGFSRLFDALIRQRCDLAVGSRRLPASRVTRSFGRRVLSEAYNRLVRLALNAGFTDAQTGFKAMTREIVRKVLPLVEDDSWFLDTELLVRAERLGYRIADIPVTWVEDDDSRVRILRTGWDDLRGIARLRRELRHGGSGAAAAGKERVS